MENKNTDNKSNNSSDIYNENEIKKKNKNSRSNGAQSLENQITDLKSLLLQRDTEISILVNMVNNGKNGDDVRASTNSPIAENNDNNYNENYKTKNNEKINRFNKDNDFHDYSNDNEDRYNQITKSRERIKDRDKRKGDDDERSRKRSEERGGERGREEEKKGNRMMRGRNEEVNKFEQSSSRIMVHSL